jgi:hypothetical protein
MSSATKQRRRLLDRLGEIEDRRTQALVAAAEGN